MKYRNTAYPNVLKDKGQLVVYQTLNQTDWKIVGVIPKASITRSVEYIKVLMIMLLGAGRWS